jgi:hypothetical protein
MEHIALIWILGPAAIVVLHPGLCGSGRPLAI